MRNSYHLKLALVYLVFGIFWILLTDLYLFREITDSLIHYRIEMIKGVFFVVASTGLIYLTSKFLTARIEKEKEANKSLALLLDNATDAILVKSEEGEILYWNKGAENLYGWPRDEVLGKELSGVIKYSINDIRNVVEGVESSGQWFGEMVTRKRDGKQITTYTRWSRIDEFEDSKNPVLIISSDISEMKELEERLKRIQKLENLGLLSSEIAHDLNNVIQPILMSTDILSESVNDPKLQKITDMIRQSARRGSELVQQILTFSKGLKSKKTFVDTEDVISEVVGISQRTFPEGITVEYESDGNINSIFGVRTQIDQVLMNLIVNARDAVRNNGHIKVKAENYQPSGEFTSKHRTDGGTQFVRLTVEDNGSGISPEIMQKIYEPFFTTKSSESGNGIGLSTCRRIVEEHEGIIEVQSEPGKGTEFSVYLPSSPGVAEESVTDDIQDEHNGHGQCVLVADDELFVRELLKNVLESANYSVLTADNGEEVLSMLSGDGELGNSVRAVITDLEMPNLNGEELVRRLKSMNSNIKVIVISGSTDLDQYERLRNDSNCYVDSFILKPFSNQKLLNSLRQVI